MHCRDNMFSHLVEYDVFSRIIYLSLNCSNYVLNGCLNVPSRLKSMRRVQWHGQHHNTRLQAYLYGFIVLCARLMPIKINRIGSSFYGLTYAIKC